MSRDELIRMAIKCNLVTTGNRGGVYMDALERFATLIVEAEREACAALLEDHNRFGDTRDCAAAIRARGEK